MFKTTRHIPLCLYLIINILFVDKYAARITDFHWIVALFYLFGAIFTILFITKHIANSAYNTRWEVGLGIMFLFVGIGIQYALDPYAIQVDRWSAIHNFLATMLQGDYPYGASTHLGGYGSPFPVWQLFHLPFYAIGNVGLSIFVVTIAFIATLHHFYSSKTALIAILLLGISPAFWYEIAVRSDLITNILLVATIAEWLTQKQIKLNQYPILLGVLSGLVLSTRLIAIIPLCVVYGYEFLQIGWKKQLLFILTTIAIFALTFLPFLLWNGSTLLFFEYNPFILQTRQGSGLVLLIFAIIAIGVTLYAKGNHQYRLVITGLLLTLLVVMAFVEKMWQLNLWNGLFSSAFDITYLSTALPFYIAYLSCSIQYNKRL